MISASRNAEFLQGIGAVSIRLTKVPGRLRGSSLKTHGIEPLDYAAGRELGVECIYIGWRVLGQECNYAQPFGKRHEVAAASAP